METVVLFADISGFTNISEACARMGVRGNEELAFCINRYMEGMVKSLGKYGGDIIKFVGDAMIVMWPRTTAVSSGNNGSSSPIVDDRTTVVRKAIQCALDIQNELNNKKIMTNVTNLSVKIGIGFGDCALLYVGGVFNRAEFFTVGEGLTQALNSEENATAGGQIIVSQNAWAQVVEFFKSEEIISEHGKHFYRIVGMKQGIRTRADAVLLRNQVQADNSKIQGKLRACVPAAIMPYLEIGYEQFGSETRRLTVMFASLGIDLSSAKSKEGMMKIQKIVTTVQQQVYRMEGSLNKLVMDDKGSTLICIWGLCPFSHEDDAARAILTAMNIRRELLKIENTWCNMGISTGEVFSGVVGTSGSRKEFSVLGDYVNLAARIMYWPKKYKQYGKIYVDMQTKREAENFINFNYKDHCEFKGKSISLPIFEPMDPLEESYMCIKKIVGMETFLKIHSNPFLIDKSSEYKKKNAKQIGRDSLLTRVCDDLLDFFDEDNQENQNPYIMAIYGETGSGKTLFARCIFDFVRKRKDLFRDNSLGPDQKPVLTSSLNAESQMKFLNIWRPILQMMLFIMSKKARMAVEDVLAIHLKNIRDERYDIILDIFGMTQMKPNGEIVQLPLPNDPFQFVKREQYSEDLVESILDIIIEIISSFLGKNERGQHLSEDFSDDFESQTERYQKSRKPNSVPSESTPVIVILDTVYFMDEASWRLLELIKDECSKIAIILLVQTDTNNQPRIHPEAKQYFKETFGSNSDWMRTIDLPPFHLEDLSACISEISQKYQSHMGEEIHLMTYIDDPEHSIKNPEVCKVKAAELKKQFMIQDNSFNKINEEVLKLVLQRCEGNPLISLAFLFNLLANGYLVQKGQCLEPTPKFTKCKQRQDWSTVPAAGLSLKINCTLLDTFLKEMRAKPNKMDQETSVKGLLMLKCAAVVGDVFGSRVLQNIVPLRHETHSSILHILKILESKDLIEILDESDPKNAICRFRKIFLRESIYQTMLYRAQKKGIHQLVVQHIQDNPNSIDQDLELETEKLLQHILLAEDLDSEDQIPLKSKQGLIIKKIATMLIKNPGAAVKKGMLTKQGDKPNKKVEERYMVLKPKQLSWYHDAKEYEQGKAPLGVIYVQSIYHCMPAQTAKPTDDLNIGTCAWRKKDQEKEGNREFIFGAQNQTNRDEWISCIEYLRTKAIYDSFVSKYCNITFPMRRQSEEVTGDSKQDLMKQLNDFASKFRSQAILNKSPSGEDYQSGVYQHAASKVQRNSSLKKQTRHISSFMSNNNLTQIQENSVQSTKELAQKIKKLFNVSIVSYVSHIQGNGNKLKRGMANESLRKLPDALKHSALVLNLAQEEILPTLFQNQSSIHNDIPPIKKYDKVIEERRLSGIQKNKKAHENSRQDAKFKADYLRSEGTSPPERKFESNEELSSDKINPQNPKGLNLQAQRNSNISNFTAKSQPLPLTQQSQFHTSNSDLSAPVNQNTPDQIDEPSGPQSSKQEFNKKSRISVQIENLNQVSKQRTLTFQKNEGDQSNFQQHQQIFATQKNAQPHSKQLNGAMMEKIEEKEEYDPLRRGSGGTQEESKKKYKKKVVSQSSSESSKRSSDQETRRTGKFQKIDSDDESSQNSPILKKNKKKKHGEVKQPKATQDISEPNIKELINKTVQEQVSKGIQEIIQSVTQLTQQQQQQFQYSSSSRLPLASPYHINQQSLNYSYTNHNPYHQSHLMNDSDLLPSTSHHHHHQGVNLQTLSSRSSIQDYSSISALKLRIGYTSNNPQNGGGATSSSKRMVLEQIKSKGQGSNTMKNHVAPLRHQRDERKSEVDDDDTVISPDVSGSSSDGDERNAQQYQMKPPVSKNIRRDTIFNPVPYKNDNQELFRNRVREKASSQSKSPPSTIQHNQSEHRNSSQLDQKSLFQQSVQGGAMPSNNNSRLDSLSPTNNYHHQFKGVKKQNHQRQPQMSNYLQNDQQVFNFQDYFMNHQMNNQQFFPGQMDNYSPDSPQKSVQLAIVMEDVQSIQTQGNQNGDAFMQQLYEGDKVEVLRIINAQDGQQYAECSFEGLVGVFPIGALKLLKRTIISNSPSPQRKKKSAQEIESQRSKLKLNERKKKQTSSNNNRF